jgi:hypothetical protein
VVARDVILVQQLIRTPRCRPLLRAKAGEALLPSEHGDVRGRRKIRSSSTVAVAVSVLERLVDRVPEVLVVPVRQTNKTNRQTAHASSQTQR